MPRQRHGVRNHWFIDYLFNSLFGLATKKLHITGPLLRKSFGDGGFPWQRVSNVEDVLWHHAIIVSLYRIDNVYSRPNRYFCQCWFSTLQWRHNERDGVWNHQPHDYLLNRLSRRRSKTNQSSASLAFVRGLHRSPVNSPHTGSVTRKMFPSDDVIMKMPQAFLLWHSCHVRGNKT